ncbi:MAG: LysR family transcriptional regulator [Proteobacteria bacterium]|nr:LysR family transcriptional regulator [Pseudomonadota bacterium]
MELKDIDLNLLVVFQQLLVDRRVSTVATSLGLSQPGVSNALARLRKLTGDALFLRTPTGMQPTPYAQQLAEPTARALQVIHEVLNQKSSFDPTTSRRAFTVGMTDIGEIYFLPRLMKELAQVAPNVSLSTVRNAAVNLQDEMAAGHVDLALGLLPQLKAGYFQRQLFKQHYVCMFRRGHPLDRRKREMTLREFCAAEHVVVVAEGTGHGQADDMLRRRKIVRKVVLTVPHYVAVGHILNGSDLVATVPERLAQALEKPFGLAYVRHPARLPEIGINLFWHSRYHRDPGIEWLRSLIVDLHGEGSPARNSP